MLFQVGGAGFQTAFQELQKWGFSDAILPFLLFFALLFAVLQKVHLFGKSDADGNWAGNRKLNGVAAFVIALMIVIPHIMSPSANDPVSVVNKILPASALIIFALVVILLLVGMTSMKGTDYIKSPLVQLAGLGGVLVLAYIFLATMFPTRLGIGLGPLRDPKIQALVIVVAIFAVIVWFVTKEDKKQGDRRWWTTPQELMGKGKD